MPYYRLYHVKEDHFAGVDEFEAADDATAVRHADTLNRPGTAELWCGSRKVTLFRPEPG